MGYPRHRIMLLEWILSAVFVLVLGAIGRFVVRRRRQRAELPARHRAEIGTPRIADRPHPATPEKTASDTRAAPRSDTPPDTLPDGRPGSFAPPPLPSGEGRFHTESAGDASPRPTGNGIATDSHVPVPVASPATAAPTGRASTAAVPTEPQRYRSGLEKTRRGFVAKLAQLFRGRPRVSAALKESVEEVLFSADIGTKTAEKLLSRVSELLDREKVAEPDAVWATIRSTTEEILRVPAPPMDFDPPAGPYVVLMIGVNGVGKTTTLGKLAARHARAGKRVLLVAGDTFRAAAVEQLEIWARRVGCDIHIGSDHSDPSSVIFGGISRARNEGHDVVLCDTAGRLHTRKELMDELLKIRRAAGKALSIGRPTAVAPHDTFLTLDATIGQNALVQARIFKETMDYTGLVITKLDGTAKGGIVLGICDELRLPIRYVGVGEAKEDLREFDVTAFCDGLFSLSPREAAAE